ncbi:MAG: cobalt/nickel transport system permease protein [Candidatus Poribacteria bacterium]|nr:cobalt/nickel transport system permease protein [Candidatus Poribacteria bacterium]
MILPKCKGGTKTSHSSLNYIDKYSSIDSIIHRRDPRIKIIAFVLFILCVVFTRPESFLAFALYGVFIFVLILLSKIPIKYIIKRAIIIVPFVLLIAVFIPFLKKGEVAGGYSFGTLKITVTYEGIMVFWNVMVKSFLSILCMILLMSSVKFPTFLKALEELKIPRLIVMILSFTYRYIFVIQDEFQRMLRAKESRSAGSKRWLNFKTLSNMVGVLFIKAYERGEAVYLAMCSRGFDGTIKTMHNHRFVKSDFYFLLIVIITLTSIRIIGSL